MPDVKVEYRPQGATLRSFHSRSNFVRGVIGPLGSGKTQACIAEILRRIDSQPPDKNGDRMSRWVAVRNTYPDLQTTTIRDFRAWTDQMGVGRFINGAPPRWECEYRKQDGTRVKGEVIFIAFDLPDDVKKARGLQLSGLWLNEMKELSRANVDMLMARVGRYPPPSVVRDAPSFVIGDSNAPDRDHWLARIALDEKPEGWWFGLQPGAVRREGGVWVVNAGAENMNNLPQEYYQRLLAGRPESWIRQNLANEFVYHADGRAVHPDFSETLHVRPVGPTPGIPLHVGIDFGRTPAAVVGQRQVNGQWYILRELCTTNMGALQFGELLYRMLNQQYSGYSIEVTGDPAGNHQAQTRDETPFDMLLAAGIDAFPAPSNDYEERTTALDERLRSIVGGQPAIMIDPECRTLIKGLAGAYQFKRVQVSGEDRYRDKPVKDPTSHVCEALHYLLLGAGEGAALFDSSWQKTDREMQREGGWRQPDRVFE